jgi:4-hydroxymandelate synthase
MGARDIEYIEFCVYDKAAAVDYFVHSVGFALVAESSGHGTDSALLRQGSAQLMITAGPAVGEFLERHGDGVADIALTCEAVDAMLAAGAAAGFSALDPVFGNPALPGFGDVRHTLLPAAPAGRRRPPPGRDWAGPPSAPGRPAEHIRRLDHVAVCLPAGTLAACAATYQQVFGLSEYSGEYTELGDQAMNSIVVRSPSFGVTLTLLEQDATRSAGQIAAFIDRNGGAGVQHLAFEVDDIIAAVREFRGAGVDFLSTPATYYEMLADRIPELRAEIADLCASYVLADRDEWGYLLQLFTDSPYERKTLFYELIQRRGARGFGSKNIRALYEAVERDRMTTR